MTAPFSAAPDATVDPPRFGEALAVWTKIGFLSFGGPAGQIALMHRILVDEKRWVSNKRFLAALNYCMLLPGPEAQQLAIYIGWVLHGVKGGLVAGLLFVAPGFVVILALSILYVTYQGAPWLATLFFGLKAAVLAVIAQALIRLGKRALTSQGAIGLAGAAFIAIFALGFPFPLIILGAGFWGCLQSSRPKGPRADGSQASGAGGTAWSPADLGRTLKILAIGAAFWIGPVLTLAALFGGDTIFVPIALFFSKMAVVTFGGAYAVLAYVAQQTVETLHWLKPGEMLDGLAMAETTPGPLILVLAFVGFLAAFREPGMLAPLVAGTLGAFVTAWVSFVPSFLWIFLGAPFIERLSDNRSLNGALGAVTAAVAGVILNLAVWFALHVLFREVGSAKFGPLTLAWPVWSSIDILAGLLALIAAVALFRFKLGIVATLALCAMLGLAMRWPA